MNHITSWQADIALLFVTFIWGTTFLTVKNALTGIAPFTFLAIRFSIAFIFLILYKPSTLRKLSPDQLKPGLLIGTFLFSGFAFQTIGLKYTSASNAGFITGLSVVIVPLFCLLINKKSPGYMVIIGAVLSALGLGLLTINDSIGIGKGDLFVLICAFSFALHIIFVGLYAQNHDPVHLAATQIGCVAVLSLFAAIVMPKEVLPSIWTEEVLIALAITAIPATSLALLIQNSVQKFTSASKTAIIFAMEPVFSGLMAYFWGNEILTTQNLCGAGLIFLGMIFAEIKS